MDISAMVFSTHFHGLTKPSQSRQLSQTPRLPPLSSNPRLPVRIPPLTNASFALYYKSCYTYTIKTRCHGISTHSPA
jgi:hypothetical protein